MGKFFFGVVFGHRDNGAVHLYTFCLFVCSAAFFHGQVEQPVRGLMSYVSHKDIPVLIGINEKGLFIIDHYESVS